MALVTVWCWCLLASSSTCVWHVLCLCVAACVWLCTFATVCCCALLASAFVAICVFMALSVYVVMAVCRVCWLACKCVMLSTVSFVQLCYLPLRHCLWPRFVLLPLPADLVTVKMMLMFCSKHALFVCGPHAVDVVSVPPVVCLQCVVSNLPGEHHARTIESHHNTYPVQMELYCQ